jgi:hypothetical protein
MLLRKSRRGSDICHGDKVAVFSLIIIMFVDCGHWKLLCGHRAGKCIGQMILNQLFEMTAKFGDGMRKGAQIIAYGKPAASSAGALSFVYAELFEMPTSSASMRPSSAGGRCSGGFATTTG